MVFKMICALAAMAAVTRGLAQPTFRCHEFRKRLRVQLVVGVGVGTMHNFSIIVVAAESRSTVIGIIN
jgi:NO-binding membrane sensor protein with MHYT domain